MITHLTSVDPLLLAPIVFGILTIFGRGKKKDENAEEGKAEQTPAEQKTAEQTPSQQNPQPTPTTLDNKTTSPTTPTPGSTPTSTSTPTTTPTTTATKPQPTFNGPYNKPNNTSLWSTTSPASATTPQETSLNKLLQSLLQDIPFNPPPENETSPEALTGTPDWVPPRATPPSRPMILVPGNKGGEVLTPVKPEEPLTASKVAKPAEPQQKTQAIPSKPAPIPTPTTMPRTEQVEQETKKPAKPDKPEKPEKQEIKPEPPKKPTAAAQSFDHIFDLTQGTLAAPGLVIINGQSGTGKTSLSTNLASAYLKKGSPCLLVTYDQSPASLRDTIKRMGWDATQYESQFRLLIVDGFSGQSDSLSLEPYYVEKPFDMDDVSETLVRNSQIFMGDKAAIVLDSLTGLASRGTGKDFLAKFKDLLNKVKDSGATLVVTMDMGKLSKDLTGPLEDMASCVIDLQKDGQNGGHLAIRKLNGSNTKVEPEDFEISPGKGLLFV